MYIKVDDIVKITESVLRSGKSVVIGLQTTGGVAAQQLTVDPDVI